MKIQPDILSSLQRDIALQLAHSESAALLADGRPHDLTFVNALFLDGRGLKDAGLIVASRTVTGTAEFDAAVTEFTDIQGRAFREVWERDQLALRALARAAIVLCGWMDDAQKGGASDPAKFEAARAAATAVGTVAGSLRHAGIERASLLPEEIRAMLEGFLAADPPDDAGGLVHRVEHDRGRSPELRTDARGDRR